MELGNSTPQVDAITKIVEIHGVDAMWLLTGKQGKDGTCWSLHFQR